MTTNSSTPIIKPGLFGCAVSADSRRFEFDCGNESLLAANVRPDVLFIGDSITHLWELQAYFGGTGTILINRGIGGDTSTYVRKRFAADALQLRPRLIVMKIGTNDLGWGMEQLADSIIDTISENITAMSEDARAAEIPLALCSLLPIWGPNWYPVPAFTTRKNAQIVATNARLRAIAADTGAYYIDYYSAVLTDSGELLHELAEDGIHPNAAGYTIMAHVLRETLRNNGVTL